MLADRQDYSQGHSSASDAAAEFWRVMPQASNSGGIHVLHVKGRASLPSTHHSLSLSHEKSRMTLLGLQILNVESSRGFWGEDLNQTRVKCQSLCRVACHVKHETKHQCPPDLNSKTNSTLWFGGDCFRWTLDLGLCNSIVLLAHTVILTEKEHATWSSVRPNAPATAKWDIGLYGLGLYSSAYDWQAWNTKDKLASEPGLMLLTCDSGWKLLWSHQRPRHVVEGISHVPP